MSQLLKRLLMIALMSPMLAFAQMPVDKVIATVAGEPVTQQEVLDRAKVSMQVWDQEASAIKADKNAPAALKNQKKPSAAQFQEAALNEVLQERVLLNQAKNSGISLNQNDVDKQIENVAKSNGLSAVDFKAWVVKQGGEKGWAKYQLDMGNELIIAKLLAKEVDDKVTVSEAEITEMLKDAPKSIPVAVTEHIYVEGTGAKSQAKINAAKARLTKGESFSTVAAAVSESPDKGAEKLELPTNDPTMDPAVKKEVTTQTIGSIGNVVKSKNGFYLFNVLERKEKPIVESEQRQLARELIKANKIGPAQQAWLESTFNSNQSSVVMK